MSGQLHSRLAALLGLALAAAMAVWWLAATRLALQQAMSTAKVAGSAITALWLARAILLAPFALRAGARLEWRSGTISSLALIAAGWPVLVVTAAASTRPAAAIVLGEATLLAACVVLPAVGQGLRALLPRSGIAALAGTILGCIIGVAVWTWGATWPTQSQ